eukprot:4953246-Amphidinium_carterae.1
MTPDCPIYFPCPRSIRSRSLNGARERQHPSSTILSTIGGANTVSSGTPPTPITTTSTLLKVHGTLLFEPPERPPPPTKKHKKYR